MAYFITGGTGFIGRNLLVRLSERGEPIYVLVRSGSMNRLERIVRDCGERGRLIVAVSGDLRRDRLGVAPPDRERMRGRIRHFFHLGALYDLTAGRTELEQANVEGTRHALELAGELQAGCFHLVSSIAVAGRYRGTFTEEMFNEAVELEEPYFRSKHDSEALVRSACPVPWRIYRPGMVVGDSVTGCADKIDGPYYFCKLIQQLREAVPRWLPLIGFDGGHVNLVPVDFVRDALVHLAHLPGQDGRCFHLTDPRDRRVGDVLNVFAAAAHAPTMSVRLARSVLEQISAAPGQREALGIVRRVVERLLEDLGIPRSVFGLLNHPTRFDSRQAQALLGPAGIKVPPLEDYAWRLWDYWERRLDPDLASPARLSEVLQGKTVLITGGSSGIGRATAHKLAASGARVLIVGRDPHKLAQVRAELAGLPGEAICFSCDITDAAACQALLERVHAEHEPVDILINNAGHSIRRAVANTCDRLHDYERLMRVNYLAAVRMTLGLLPAMVRRGRGQVISISSIGVLTNAARFAAYNASKAALEAFSRCAAGEYAGSGVQFTIINMPLVRTPMVEPTRIFEHLRLIAPEQAADLVCEAIIRRPERVASGLGVLAQLTEILAPRIGRAIQGESFRILPESEAAGGAAADAQPSAELREFLSVMRGVRW